MKHLLFTAIILLCSIMSYAQKGYDIKVKFKQPTENNRIYLAKYYAKPIPNKIYTVDSAIKQKDGSYHFKNTEQFLGGVYLIIFNNNTKWMDILVDNGIKMTLTIDTGNILRGTKIEGSKENELNTAFQIMADEVGNKSKKLRDQLATAKTKTDSTKINDQLKQLGDDFLSKRKELIAKNPGTFFSKILLAIDRPVVPEGPHYLEDGKTVDSFFAYDYTKQHYWDKFDFTDDRLIHSPIYDTKLNDYFTNYVYPIPDSVNHEADVLAAKTRNSPELFKYTLHWLGNFTRTSKVMNMDESFIYLVENYYMKGDAVWLDSTQLNQYYLEPARKMMPTVLGNVAPDLALKEAYTLLPQNLLDFDANYTILVFWQTDCPHCKEEVPRIDSLYNAAHLLEKYGAKIFSVPSPPEDNPELSAIHDGIAALKVKKDYWHHYIATDPSVNYKTKYNFIATPQVFILDKDKKILAKHINHKSIEKVILHNEELLKNKN